MRLYEVYKTIYPRLDALIKDISIWMSANVSIQKTITEWIFGDYPSPQTILYQALLYGTDPIIDVEPIFDKGEDGQLSIIHDTFRFDIFSVNEFKRPFSSKTGIITIEPNIVNAFQFANAATRESYIYAHAYYITSIIIHGLIHYLRWRNNVGARFRHYNNPIQNSFANIDDMNEAYTGEEKHTIRCLEYALGKENIPNTIQDAAIIEGKYRHHFKNLTQLLITTEEVKFFR